MDIEQLEVEHVTVTYPEHSDESSSINNQASWSIDGQNENTSQSENSYNKPSTQNPTMNSEAISACKKRTRKLIQKMADQLNESRRTRSLKGAQIPLIKSERRRKRTKLISAGVSSSKDISDLSQRRDVVNKTILRAMRRYFSQKLKTDFPQEYEGKRDKQNRFFSNVRNLAVQIFGESHQDIECLHFYLASIIDHKCLSDKDRTLSGASESDLKIFYSCLYKYSHTRLVNLFRMAPLAQIFREFYLKAKDTIFDSEVSL
jgi:hypothetical protein